MVSCRFSLKPSPLNFRPALGEIAEWKLLWDKIGCKLSTLWGGWSQFFSVSMIFNSQPKAIELHNSSHIFLGEIPLFYWIWLLTFPYFTRKFGRLFCQWEFQYPKIEVPYHIWPYFECISPYIGLVQALHMVGTSNKSDPVASPLIHY